MFEISIACLSDRPKQMQQLAQHHLVYGISAAQKENFCAAQPLCLTITFTRLGGTIVLP